ncbi:MAG TPA: hybrid sensor histidine kinase/response regulator [Polyangiaceae bacterium]|jgi:CheY-like chemotaxis protein/nitrogen-specific signal transduction histidine kinase|nr:hybrid sensor histidine kinase/response regulator [Polyangiaceae bacterium]
MTSDSHGSESDSSEVPANSSIPELLLANAALQKRVQVLEEAVRARDSVLSVVAHDLRNPLNIVSLAANTLLPQLTDAAARRILERILRSARRADQMLSDLLTTGAIETGQFTIDPAPVDAAELILGALESQYSLATSASVIVAADVSPGLPPLLADEKRLVDVLENLVGNAVKFTAPGGSITIGANNQGSEILLWVKDTGTGIAPEQLPHIFDRFWQAEKKERRGIGLGLSICKAIVEAHGGQIWAESTIGVGTTMFFTIPAVPQLESKSRPTETAKILLVDDRPENLLSLKAILERPGYELVTAKSGQEALAFALRESFAVALVDIAMPGMSGLEVAVHLKELERSRDIPIIFVTAFGDDPDEIHRAYSAGGADYLVKPLDPEVVRKKVAVFVDLSRRPRRITNPERS